MNKQEATEFVREKLRSGHHKEEIIRSLTKELGAPQEMVERFVLQIEANVVSAASQDAQIEEEQQSAGANGLKEEIEPLSILSEAATFVMKNLEQGHSKEEIASELSERSGESLDQAAQFVELIESRLPKTPAPEAEPKHEVSEVTVDLDTPEVIEYVLFLQKRKRLMRDIIYAVCERTGANWSQAETFVHKVIESKKRKRVSKNSTITVISTILIILGLLLAFIGFIIINQSLFSVLILNLGWSGIQSMPSEYGLASFLAGLGLVVGGMVGFVITLWS